MMMIGTVPCAATMARAPTIGGTGGPPPAVQLAELWIAPGPVPRDLFAGPGGRQYVRPATDARFDVVKRDTRGLSTYDVRDERDREWSVNVESEAQTEVVASRIVWALGYHERPSYFVERLIAVDRAKGSTLGDAGFRPTAMGLKVRAPYQGLLAARYLARIRQKITEGLERR